MSETNNVFISWSGERSRKAAEALRDWLPIVLQASSPWMSEEDIEKGTRGLEEVGKALDGMKIGIVCLTPENLTAQWILYEVGSLAKTLGQKTRVCTFLLGGLRPQEIRPPLGMFQATRADDKDDTKKMVRSINNALGGPVAEDKLDSLFDMVWPRLEEGLSAIPAAPEVAKPTRGVPEMVEEILELSRGAAGSRKVIEQLDAFMPTLARLTESLGNLSWGRTAFPPVSFDAHPWLGGLGIGSGVNSLASLGGVSPFATAAAADAATEKWHLSPAAAESLKLSAARGALRPKEIETAAAAVDAAVKAADEEAKRRQALKMLQKVEAEKNPANEGK